MIRSLRRQSRLTALVLFLTIATASVTEAYRYIAFEQVTIGASAIGFTALKITPVGLPQASHGLCRLETAQIRFTYDGTTPTASVGELWEIGEERQFNGHDVLSQFLGIRTGGTSGQLDCHYDTQ